MLQFLDGAITLGFVGVGVFFLKYWRATRDFLFAAFALSSWLLAANQALLATSLFPQEERSWVFLLRLAAFVVIAAAILIKNVER
jgi:hypothetical protein